MRKKQIATAADFGSKGTKDLRQTKQPQDMRYCHFCTLPPMSYGDPGKNSILTDECGCISISRSRAAVTPWALAVICIFASFLPHRERCKMQEERAANCVLRLRVLIGFALLLQLQSRYSIININPADTAAPLPLNTQINPFQQLFLGKCQMQPPIKDQTMAGQMRETECIHLRRQ